MKNLDLEISESIKIYGSLRNFLNAMDCTDIEDYKKMRSYDFINGRVCLMK